MCRKISILIIEQIKELNAQGKSIRKIAEILGVSRNTTRKYLREIDGEEASKEPEDFSVQFKRVDWRSKIPWDTVIRKRNSGFQIDRLHQEFAPEGVSYWSFNRAINKIMETKIPANITIPQQHKAGEKTQIDYTDGLPIIDRYTGKKTKTQLFCGVLPFSGYTFGEFTFNQKLPSFIKSHENMWSFFGGVTVRHQATPPCLKPSIFEILDPNQMGGVNNGKHSAKKTFKHI